jgi:Mg-chelatase subunit ChlD
VQRIDSVTHEELPLDVVLVLDTSESVTGEPLQALVAAARVLLDQKQASDRVALLTFSERIRGPVALTTEAAPVRAALDRMVTGGSTSLLDAAYGALVLQHASRSRALVLLFTDGRDTTSWFRPNVVLDLARRTDAVVYGIELALASTSSLTMSQGNPPPFLEELAAVDRRSCAANEQNRHAARSVRAGAA